MDVIAKEITIMDLYGTSFTGKSRVKWLSCFLLLLSICEVMVAKANETTRSLLSEAVLEVDEAKRIEVIRKLSETGDDFVAEFFELWKQGEVFIHTDPVTAGRTVVTLADPGLKTPSVASKVSDGKPFTGADGKVLSLVPSDLKAADTSRALRKEMKETTEFLALASPEVKVRLDAAFTIGMMQKKENIPPLERRLEVEEDKGVRKMLREGIALSYLASGTSEESVRALGELAELKSVSGRDVIVTLIRKEEAATTGGKGDGVVLTAANKALMKIDSYLAVVDTFGTAFRGLSLGSVLLIVALGLAITFGLMGVINMAHGEMIAIGAYTTYLTEKYFTSWFGAGSFGFEVYFLVAIPMAFITASVFGAIMERGIIQFLYKRPLESLLATWGVSLIIQQSFRLIFGASNRQVNSPQWLMGSFEVSDVTLGYNRLFVILFAGLIVLGTWLLMTKTPIGLCIRSVMQNPQMAACMGIRTARVRMLTFAFGSGLAGLAGAFLSQIGNVGPALGQSYIVDSFMVVVAGGAGNLIGTVISALTIGLFDQVLQPFFGPVMGKVSVLIAIIIFLQWRPGGLFPTRSRALD
jgi:urea transport system permease protein